MIKQWLEKRKKRSRDQGGMDESVTNQIIWTQQSGDPQVDAVDTTAALGAFIAANAHAVNTLNVELDRRKEEISKLKEEMDH